ncbi:transposable element Tcb2 transposase [Trichonephila clavipes]|nr:transposable element Tcb2 transposase [Trichonephila clavipes]
MAQTDHTAFSRQLAAQWSTATRVSLYASSIRRRLLQRGLRARIPFYAGFLSRKTIAACDYTGPMCIGAGVLIGRLPGAVFQQDNARPHVAKTVKSYLDSQQVQLLPWPAYSPDMSPIEHERDIVERRIARDLRPVASTDELLLRIQTIWNTLPQTDIKNLFNSMPRRVAALTAARGGHTKY